MKKVFKLLLTFMLTVGLMFCVSAMSFAAGETLSVTANQGSANVGDTISYTIRFTSNDPVTVFEGVFNYDASCLKPVSGGNNVVFDGTSGEATATFQVISAGNTTFSVTGTPYVIGVASSSLTSSSSVAVTAPTQAPTAAPTQAPTPAPTQAPTPAPTQAPTPAPTQAPTPAPTQAPTPAPTQAPTPAPTQAPTAAPIQAPTEEATANIVSESEELRMAALEDASTEDAPTEESTTEESSEAEVPAENELNLAESLDGISVPSGAEQITYNYHGKEIQAAKTADGLYLLPVIKDDGAVQWHVYNENQDTSVPYTRFSNLDNFFVIVPLDDGVEIPEEFIEILISLDGCELPAWRNPLINDNNMYFIYAMNENGEKKLYRFDGAEGMLVRYVQDVEQTEAMTEATLAPEVEEELSRYREQNSVAASRYQALNQEYEKDMLYRALIIIGLGALTLILLLVIAILASKLRDDDDEEEDEKEEKDVQYSESGIRVKPRDRKDRIADDDTRNSGREEGTSPVRPAKKKLAVSDNADFARTSTTSEVKTAAPKRTAAKAAVEGAAAEKRRPSGEAPRKRPAAEGERRRPSGEQPVRRKPAAQGTTAEGVKRTRPVRKPVDTAAKKSVTNTEIWNESETEKLTIDFTEESKTTLPTAEENMTESVKVVTRKKAVKPVVEDLFEDEASSSNDFDITDFKDI